MLHVGDRSMLLTKISSSWYMHVYNYVEEEIQTFPHISCTYTCRTKEYLSYILLT